jgi:membrane protein required for colicin V production
MIFDLILLCMVALAFWRGWKKGLLWAVGSVLAMMVGVMLSLRLSHLLADFLFDQKIIQSHYTVIISFVVIFILTMFIFRQVAKMMETLLDKLFLGWVNNVLGGALYAFVVVFMSSLGIWLLQKTTLLHTKAMQESKAMMFIQPVAPKTITVLSAYLPFCKNIMEQVSGAVHRASEAVEEL